jgi:hypothetical protein
MRDFRDGFLQSAYIQEVFRKLDHLLWSALKPDWLMRVE